MWQLHSEQSKRSDLHDFWLCKSEKCKWGLKRQHLAFLVDLSAVTLCDVLPHFETKGTVNLQLHFFLNMYRKHCLTDCKVNIYWSFKCMCKL